MTERELLERAQSCLAGGDALPTGLRKELDALFERTRTALVRTCAARTLDRSRAEDIAHEALLIAWRRLPEYQITASFHSWAVGICRKLIQSGRRRISERLTEDGVLDAASDLVTALEGLRDEEQELVLHAAMATLPQLEQDALHYRYFDGAAVDDITRALGLTNASGARGLLVGARRHLEKELRRSLDALNHGSSFFVDSSLR